MCFKLNNTKKQYRYLNVKSLTCRIVQFKPKFFWIVVQRSRFFLQKLSNISSFLIKLSESKSFGNPKCKLKWFIYELEKLKV